MKSISEQLSTYKSVHLNASNVKTHFIGIPLIIWSAIVLLSQPAWHLSLFDGVLMLDVADVIAIAIVIYYFALHLVLAVMALAIFAPVFFSAQLVASHDYAIVIAVLVFVIGWIFQFIGHGYEKAKPAFVDDLNQLLIGPLFLIAEIYFYLRPQQTLAKNVHQLAIEKRQQFEQAKQTKS